MVIHLNMMNVNNYSIDSWLHEDGRVSIRADRYFESGNKLEVITVEFTREEFLSFFAHLSVIEMNMKK